MSLNLNEIAKDCLDAMHSKYTSIHDLEQEHTRVAHLCSNDNDILSISPTDDVKPSIIRYGGGAVSRHKCYMCNNLTHVDAQSAKTRLHKLSYMPAYFVVICETCHENLYV
jgi:hypothetical protein